MIHPIPSELQHNIAIIVCCAPLKHHRSPKMNITFWPNCISTFWGGNPDSKRKWTFLPKVCKRLVNALPESLRTYIWFQQTQMAAISFGFRWSTAVWFGSLKDAELLQISENSIDLCGWCLLLTARCLGLKAQVLSKWNTLQALNMKLRTPKKHPPSKDTFGCRYVSS